MGDACLDVAWSNVVDETPASMSNRSDAPMSMSNASALSLGGDDSGSVFMGALAWGSDLVPGDSDLALGACNECGAADIEVKRSVNEDPRMKFASSDTLA